MMRRTVLSTMAAMVAIQGCSPECSNNILLTRPSPGGKYSAALFSRSCGATTAASSQVSIIGRGTDVSGGGNVYIADSNHGQAPMAPWGGPLVTLSWETDRHLVIGHDPRARVFLKNDHLGEVRITYRSQ